MGIDVELIHGDFKSDVFTCAICQELLEDAVMIQTCEHYFCRACIYALSSRAVSRARNTGGFGPDLGRGGFGPLPTIQARNCPECRTEFTPDKIKKPVLFMTPFFAGA